MNQRAVGVEAHYISPCPACATPAPTTAGQSLVRDRIEWSAETDCASCGPVLACGRGDTPEPLRSHLLTTPATLRLTGAEADPVAVMKVLRAHFGADLARARALLADLRGDRLTGTPPEIEQLARALGVAGVDADWEA